MIIENNNPNMIPQLIVIIGVVLIVSSIIQIFILNYRKKKLQMLKKEMEIRR